MYRIENDELIAEFKSLGAECQRLYSKKTKTEFLWSGDKAYWRRHAPILFPIIGRLKENVYHYEGKTYSMSSHGFARDSEFEVFAQSKEMISFVLKANEETKKVYPFDFALKITYRLVASKLEVSMQVDNMGTSNLYFNIGGHPGFSIPYHGGQFEDYRLTIKSEEPANRYFVTKEGFIASQSKEEELPFDLQLTHDLFAHDALIYRTTGATKIYLHHCNDSRYIEVGYDKLPFVGIWSPYPKKSPFVCIEPWVGMADTEDSDGQLCHKVAIQKVAPNDYWRKQYYIQIHE